MRGKAHNLAGLGGGGVETHALVGGGQLLLDEGQRDGHKSLVGDLLPRRAAVVVVLLRNTREL